MSLQSSAQSVSRVTALVSMARRQRFVLVESGTEVDLLRPHVGDRATIEDLDGRPNVQEAWRILENRGAQNFRAVIDADFDEVVGRNQHASQIVYVSVASDPTDSTIDLEATLIRTPALQQLCETVIGEPLCRLGGPIRFTEQLRESTRAAAAAVGAFRAAVMDVFKDCGAVQGIGELETSEWNAVVDASNGEVDRQALDGIIDNRIRNRAKCSDVRLRARDFEKNEGTGWRLCRGHDMTEILALRFRHLTGRPITRAKVEKVLCENYRGNLFSETAFGAKLQEFCGVA